MMDRAQKCAKLVVMMDHLSGLRLYLPTSPPLPLNPHNLHNHHNLDMMFHMVRSFVKILGNNLFLEKQLFLVRMLLEVSLVKL